jgi:hypothetical protein
MPRSSDDEQTTGGTPARQWITDRVHGKCKYDRRPEDRPPCNLCWPSPIVKYFPALLEENILCGAIGRIGCMKTDQYKANYSILRLALSLSFWGFICTIYASIALTENPNVLEVTSFSRGKVTSDSGVLPNSIKLFIGLRGVLIDNPNTSFGRQFVAFEDFCNYDDIGSFVKEEKCSNCEDSKLQLFLFLLFAIVAYVLAMIGSENLRMYPFYEISCTRTFGFLYSMVSLACSVLLWYFYWSDCLGSFHDGEVFFSSGGVQVDPDSSKASISVDFSWKVGFGLILLWAGAGLKVISFVLSCLVPTPSITRDKEEQERYEKMPYPER